MSDPVDNTPQLTLPSDGPAPETTSAASSSQQEMRFNTTCPASVACRTYLANEAIAIEHVTARHATILGEASKLMTAVSGGGPWGTHKCREPGCRYEDRKVEVIRHLRDVHGQPRKKMTQCPLCDEMVAVSVIIGHLKKEHEEEHAIILTITRACEEVPGAGARKAVRCRFCEITVLRDSIPSHLVRKHREECVNKANLDLPRAPRAKVAQPPQPAPDPSPVPASQPVAPEAVLPQPSLATPIIQAVAPDEVARIDQHWEALMQVIRAQEPWEDLVARTNRFKPTGIADLVGNMDLNADVDMDANVEMNADVDIDADEGIDSDVDVDMDPDGTA